MGKVRKTFDCSLCQITCYSPATFSDHMNGKAHKKKVETSDVPNGNFHCEICNIGATDQGGFDLHLAGKKHYKKAVQELAQQRLRSLKEIEPEKSMTVPEDKTKNIEKEPNVENHTSKSKLEVIYFQNLSFHIFGLKNV